MKSPLSRLALAALCLVPLPVTADPPSRVEVTNLPAVQEVSGEVTVSDPVVIDSSRRRSVEAVVSPASRLETADWTPAGMLEAESFSSVTVGFIGRVQGTAVAGVAGVVLIPDHPDVLEALREEGRPQLALSTIAQLSSASRRFESEPVTHRLLFPRYRVYLYNATPTTSDMTVFFQLSSD